MKQIFLVYTYSDELKSRSAEKLAMVTTSQRKVKSFIKSCIERGDMSYGDSDLLSAKKQANLFAEDWKTKTRYELNTNLQFGSFETVYDGEEV